MYNVLHQRSTKHQAPAITIEATPALPGHSAVAPLPFTALQALDCYRKALQAADNNNSEYAARAKALSKAIGKKVQIAKAQVGQAAGERMGLRNAAGRGVTQARRAMAARRRMLCHSTT